MNKDDLELFGKLKEASLSPDNSIVLVERSKTIGRSGADYVVGMMKRHGSLSSIKKCRLYYIDGCPDYALAYATSKEEDFDIRLGSQHGPANMECIKTIKGIISNYANIQSKHLKAWNSSVIEQVMYDGVRYSYCIQMRKDVMVINRFLHASNDRPSIVSGKSSASSLMSKYCRSKEIARAVPCRKLSPGEAGCVPKGYANMQTPKKWFSYAGFLEKLLFLKNAKLTYQYECIYEPLL